MSKLMIIDGAAYKYQIWDTAGQEKYHSLAPMYYRNAAAALLVYDITNAKSFGMLKQWVGELKKLGPENIIIVVCGNKADLEAKRVSLGRCGVREQGQDGVGAPISPRTLPRWNAAALRCPAGRLDVGGCGVRVGGGGTLLRDLRLHARQRAQGLRVGRLAPAPACQWTQRGAVRRRVLPQ